MAKTVTFLAAVNATLKRVSMIAGSSGELTSFTDSARQTDVDVMRDAWNDVLDELRDVGALDGQIDEGTITLATSDRSYALASTAYRIIGNPVNATNNHVLFPYPDRGAGSGWLQFRQDTPDPTDRQGQPRYWMLNPTTGEIEIDSTPTSDENGDVYTYAFEKAVNLTATTDTFPFDDEVVRMLYSAVAEVWNRDRKAQFDEARYMRSMARATRALNQRPGSRRWGLRRAGA